MRMNRLHAMIDKVIEGPDGIKYIQINPKTDGRIISLYPWSLLYLLQQFSNLNNFNLIILSKVLIIKDICIFV